MFIETEKLHAKVRRYTSPEEHPFFPDFLPEPVLPALEFPDLVFKQTKKVNVNTEIMGWYTSNVISRLCVDGDDEQHGSSVLCDILAMQAISRRIHFGKFVAESKFLSDPDGYTDLVTKGDVAGILALLTNTEVERKVLRRSHLKASTYGQDVSVSDTSGEGERKVDPMLIADLYRDMIIPLTKDVEVRYLYNRVGAEPPSPDTYFHICAGPRDAFEKK